MIYRYTVINPKRMMRITDHRVSKRTQKPRNTKGVILIDSGDLSKINIDCDIVSRKNCWELYISPDTEQDIQIEAEKMNAVAWMAVD